MTINITNIDTHIAVCPLHTKAVTEAISNYTPNRVLGTPPLDISPLESFLPRPVRTTLAQLRSGHCRLLKLYMARITTGVSDVCSECGVATHSVGHLFSCSAHPTQLTVQDLWDNPAEVADFLNLDSWRQWTRIEELLGYHNNNNNIAVHAFKLCISHHLYHLLLLQEHACNMTLPTPVIFSCIFGVIFPDSHPPKCTKTSL